MKTPHLQQYLTRNFTIMWHDAWKMASLLLLNLSLSAWIWFPRILFVQKRSWIVFPVLPLQPNFVFLLTFSLFSPHLILKSETWTLFFVQRLFQGLLFILVVLLWSFSHSTTSILRWWWKLHRDPCDKNIIFCFFPPKNSCLQFRYPITTEV